MRPTAILKTSNVEYFDQLPQILKNFFKKHTPANQITYSSKPTFINNPAANPFLPNKNPLTLKYREPSYSLRRQSVLFKTAKKYGIEDLLPSLLHNKQFYENKFHNKTFMKGVLKPKGHKHELGKEERQEKIKRAMAGMDQMITDVKGKKYQKRLEKKKKQQRSWV